MNARELHETLENARQNLIDNMVLYGYPKEQAEIQIDALLGLKRQVDEMELY